MKQKSINKFFPSKRNKKNPHTKNVQGLYGCFYLFLKPLEIVHGDRHHPVVGYLVRIVHPTVLQVQLTVCGRSAFILDTERPVFQIVADHRCDAVYVVDVVETEDVRRGLAQQIIVRTEVLHIAQEETELPRPTIDHIHP